jgi:hypothetical protein
VTYEDELAIARGRAQYVRFNGHHGRQVKTDADVLAVAQDQSNASRNIGSPGGLYSIKCEEPGRFGAWIARRLQRTFQQVAGYVPRISHSLVSDVGLADLTVRNRAGGS